MWQMLILSQHCIKYYFSKTHIYFYYVLLILQGITKKKRERMILDKNSQVSNMIHYLLIDDYVSYKLMYTVQNEHFCFEIMTKVILKGVFKKANNAV